MRLLKAFAWLQWRLIANGLRAAERRDTFEKISRVTALLAPGLLLAAAAISVVTATGLGALAGWTSIAHGLQSGWILQTIRVVLLIATVFAMIIPLFIGTRGGSARFTRLLLLPIPTRQLHFTEVVTTLTDPWIIFVAPGLVAYGGGIVAAALAAGSSFSIRPLLVAGAIVIIAAMVMAAVLASLSALVAFLVSWIVRDRRRQEVFIVVLVLTLSLVSIVPAIVSDRVEHSAATGGLRGRSFNPSDWPAWTRALPSELYAETVGSALGLSATFSSYGALAPVVPFAAMLLEGGVLYALSAAVHRRLLESAQAGRSHRARGAGGPVALRRIPGFWPGTSAVAVAQMRTALRSVRGRLVVLLPGPLVAALALAIRQLAERGHVQTDFLSEGYAVLASGIIFGLYAAQPFTMNQFGSDRAGLTLEFLVPVRDVDLIRGKAMGCGAIIGAGVAITLACALLVAPGGPVLLWLATLEGGVACYLLIAPLAAWFSVLFPVAADLSKTGAGGNPHTLAMLGGMIVVAVAAIPEAAILLVASPLIAVIAMTCWTAIVWIGCTLTLGLVARALRARRENLALIAQAR